MKTTYITLTILFSAHISIYAQKEHKTYHSNGNVEEQGQIDENGQETGEWKYYDYHGNLIQIGKYKSGKKEGEWKKTLGKTQIWNFQNYKNGILFGETKSIYKDVYLIFKGQYDENGKQTGEWKSYNRFGTRLENISKYENGTATEYIDYYETGELKSITKYYVNTGLAELREYYSNGKLKSTGLLAGTTYVGNWSYYDFEGNLVEIKKEGNAEINKALEEYLSKNPLPR